MDARGSAGLLGRGMKVFDAAAVQGRWRSIESPDDVVDLMDSGADGVVALVRDAGATFLAPIFHELTAVVCTGGTPRSHIGIVSREFQVPCVMACAFDGAEPADGAVIEIDCSGSEGVVRLVELPGAAGSELREPPAAREVFTSTALLTAPPASVPSSPPGVEGSGATASTASVAEPARDRRAPRTLPDEATMKAVANELIAYHSPISRALTDERTSLESRLIPVSAYIIVACVEAWYRYPALMEEIEAAMPAEEIGRRARRPGCRVNTVHLWSIPNFWLIGRKVMGALQPDYDPVEPAYRVLDFWQRASMAFRADGTRQAADNGVALAYPDEVIASLLGGCQRVDDAERASIKQFNATLVAYLFLLYFDTRVGAGDTGPYELPDGNVLLVRDYYQMAQSDFWWSDVAADVPYRNLTAAFVLDGVSFRVTDFGTSYTTPEDYLDHVVSFGLYEPQADGSLRPVPHSEIGSIVAAVRSAQAKLYRRIVAMDRHEKIRCGAYVYFSFLRTYAEVAGVADQLDWTVPKDIPQPLYDMVSMIEGENSGVEEEGDYYAPIA